MNPITRFYIAQEHYYDLRREAAKTRRFALNYDNKYLFKPSGFLSRLRRKLNSLWLEISMPMMTDKQIKSSQV